MVNEAGIARLDLRGLPVWERPDLVFEAFDRLPAGATLTFVTENEPRGLSARISQARKHQVLLAPRRIGDREWHVSLTRTPIDADEQSVQAVLRRCAPFAVFNDAERDRIAAAASVHTARRGQTVVSENAEWPFLGVVIDGVVALSCGEVSPRQRIFYEVFPNEVFGETEFFDGALTLGRISVLSKSAKYVRIPRDVALTLGNAQPRMFLELAEILAQRSRGLAAALTAQATVPILARIAHVLLPYAMPEQGLSSVLPTLLNVTQAQIAASAGTVKEVAARAIAELEARSLLRRERGHIRYLDRQGLLDLIRDLA